MKPSKKKRSLRTGTYRKDRGAVTIFLVIVLVPCIALSSISVDLSRVQLSKASAVSAADLALNTLLTNYDGDLNDWYGMIGSCQDIQNYYTTTSGYFTRSLSSKGLSDNELLLLSDVISNKFGDDQFFDVLQVEVVDGVTIQEVAGANLGNPTLVKDQIVEFMKYRAPIELTKGIIDRLMKDTSLNDADADDAVEAEENKPLVEAKEDFYEAEGELLKGAYRSYLAIKKYRKKIEEVNLTNEKLAEYAGKINGYRDTYRPIHDIAVSNLLNTEKLNYTYYRKTTNIGNYYNYDVSTMPHVYSRTETMEGTDEVFYYISGSRMNKLVGDAESAISKFDSAKTAYQNSVASIMGTPPEQDAVNDIQWWVRMHKAVYENNGNLHSKLSSAADTMMEYIRTLNAALECMPDPKSTPSGDSYSRCYSAISQIESRYNNYLSSSASASDPYVNAANTLARVSAANIKNVKSNLVTVSVNGSNMTVDNAIKTTGEALSSIYSELVSVRNLLDVAIDGDGGKTPSLSTLADMADAYDKGLDNYQTEANSSTTGMGETERKEIAQEKENEKINDAITRDSVEELKKRLTNIRSQLNTLIKAVEDLKYGGTSLKDIKTFAKFREAALTQISASSIPLKNSEINSLRSSSFTKLFVPSSGKAVDLKNTTGNSHNPQLNLAEESDPEATDTPELLRYLHSKFNSKQPEKLEENVNQREAEQDDAKDKRKEAESGAKNKGRYHGGGTNLRAYGAQISFADGAWGTLVELIEILKDISKVTSIRDDLYVTSYIMEMFSYATFEEEGMYDLVENKTELKLPTGANEHTPAEYKEVLGSESTPKSWLSASVEDPYNKTLTNKLINKTNNVAYAAEVEYILKGQANNPENVKQVYQDIYGIRYVLNLVSGFQHFWGTGNATGGAINSIASMIASLTMGVIPMPVTKALVIPILAIFETAKDLDRLEAGFPVELYKIEHSDWWIRLPDKDDVTDSVDIADNGVSANPSIMTFLDAVTLSPRSNPDKGIFYSDYLTMFVYFGLKSSKNEDMYHRVANVIEANMNRATGDFKMENVRMYFSLNTTLRVKPMMVALPYYFDDYNNLMMSTTDWCTYKVNVVRGYS